MRKMRTLDALLPKTRQGTLGATLVQLEKAWYVSELARRMGVPASSLQRELHDLSEAGILKTHRQGRMVYYQANRDSPIFPDLRGLLLKTAGLVDVLAQALRPVATKITTVCLRLHRRGQRGERQRRRSDGRGTGVAGGSRTGAAAGAGIAGPRD
jgi:DNA-binding transcriptional ArsR family regulator